MNGSRLVLNASTLLLTLILAATATAYELRLITTTPTFGLSRGSVVSYDLFLDTQGQSNIVLFSASLTFDPNVLAYRPDLSDAEDYYPLYSPASGKTIPPTWLTPVADPPALWPAPPPGLAQVNVDFIEVNLNETAGTATNLYLATLTFEAIGGGLSTMNWSFDNGGNIFNVSGVDVSGSVSMPNTGSTVFVGGPPIPEPTTALLVGLGLAGLAIRRRRAT